MTTYTKKISSLFLSVTIATLATLATLAPSVSMATECNASLHDKILIDRAAHYAFGVACVKLSGNTLFEIVAVSPHAVVMPFDRNNDGLPDELFIMAFGYELEVGGSFNYIERDTSGRVINSNLMYVLPEALQGTISYPDNPPNNDANPNITPEGWDYNNCQDGIDNDRDGYTDLGDLRCQLL